MSDTHTAELRAFWWDDSVLRYIDQRALPDELVVCVAGDVQAAIDAVTVASVSGTPCSDLFGAFGVALAAQSSLSDEAVAAAIDRIRAAVGHASAQTSIERVASVPRRAALAEARCVLDEQQRVGRAIARHARTLLPSAGHVLTHGNTGTLGTGGTGTALAAILAAARAGQRLQIFVSEGRPAQSGARLTKFELQYAGISATLFVDAAAAWILRREPIAAVIVGAHAIAANGDIVGEIGTFAIALAAAQFSIPFYVAAARATLDPALARGELGLPPGNPAEQVFDVTPGHLVTAIVTEYGVTAQPYAHTLPILASRPNFALLDERPAES